MFGCKREEIAGDRRKITIEQPGKVYCACNTVGQLEDLMGSEGSMHGGGDKFWSCIRKGISHKENVAIDGRVILTLILTKRRVDVYWIGVAHVNGRWPALCRH
jgi:hypothetical protein